MLVLAIAYLSLRNMVKLGANGGAIRGLVGDPSSCMWRRNLKSSLFPLPACSNLRVVLVPEFFMLT